MYDLRSLKIPKATKINRRTQRQIEAMDILVLKITVEDKRLKEKNNIRNIIFQHFFIK